MLLQGVTPAVPLKAFGKIKPIKVLQKNTKFNDMLARLVTIGKSLMICFHMPRN